MMFFGHSPRMMIGFLTLLSSPAHFVCGSPAKNDDRIPYLTFFFGHPPRMMIGFLT